MHEEENRTFLIYGLQQMGLKLSEPAIDQLLAYTQLLAKWSKVYNLTTVRQPNQIITHHILDSLTMLPYLGAIKSMLDVGCGAGLPGIPLAIARPDISVTLLDCQQKKINFVQHVVTSLQLSNVSTICGRVEGLNSQLSVDMVTSRAFASLKEFVTLIASLCNTKTKIVAMKGRQSQVLMEQQELPVQFKVIHTEIVKVPMLDAERCLVFLTKQEG